MRDFLTDLRKSVGRPFFRRSQRMIHVTIAWATFSPLLAAAQGTVQSSLRLGVGTFLSHDRGWNYSEPIEVFAAITRRAGSIDLEAGASFSKSFAHFSQPAVDLRAPSAYRDGFRARLGLRAPSAAQGALSALVGAELVHNRTEGEARSTTVAGTAGIGINFGSERRGSIDLRYIGFAKRLGSSRGILPLTLAWEL
jgi:hypothetical protein